MHVRLTLPKRKKAIMRQLHPFYKMFNSVDELKETVVKSSVMMLLM